jgi:hypothetical protein
VILQQLWHLQMKKSASTKLQYQSSERKKNGNFQDSKEIESTKKHNPKTNSALKSFKSAFRKFALIFIGKRKTASELIGSGDRKNTSKPRLVVSCKYDKKRKKQLFCFLSYLNCSGKSEFESWLE